MYRNRDSSQSPFPSTPQPLQHWQNKVKAPLRACDHGALWRGARQEEETAEGPLSGCPCQQVLPRLPTVSWSRARRRALAARAHLPDHVHTPPHHVHTRHTTCTHTTRRLSATTPLRATPQTSQAFQNLKDSQMDFRVVKRQWTISGT